MEEEQEVIDLTTMTIELTKGQLEKLLNNEDDITISVEDKDGTDQTVLIKNKDRINTEGTKAPVEDTGTKIKQAIDTALETPSFQKVQTEGTTIASFDKFLKLNS